ncbi:hypothetical protein [Streptacidiphilus jiangxiensis]|uniref:Uncharacterized protein n=1 Tax=Streptacidiphilus jiangxiensis TaxID=235985 RepID=A0A1H7TRI1_STRJI|nr:hypothetical protein [Streptacidiphilus jiangxiensis]SEL87391.1 hypothetical protein SAMN05414137_114163 [Streptacidiphilus jiangxiensis]
MLSVAYPYRIQGRTGDRIVLWRPGTGDAPDTLALDGDARLLTFGSRTELDAHCAAHGLHLVPDGEAELDLEPVRAWVHAPVPDPALAGALLAAWNFFDDLARSLPPGLGPGLPAQGAVHDAAYEKFFHGSALDPAAGAHAWSPDERAAVRELLRAGLTLWRSASGRSADR